VKKTKKNIVVAIYSHAELYPPTLNAIAELAKMFDQVVLVHRNHLVGDWNYPGNVIVVSHGGLMTARQQESASLSMKCWLFISFCLKLYVQILRFRPNTILLYDTIALFSFHLIRRLGSISSKVWYHNHDVSEMSLVRKFSISWFAVKAEQKSFKYLDLFSVPAKERLTYFQLNEFKGKYFFLPNYPSVAFYLTFYQTNKITDTVKLIYQGHASELHGLEEIIELLPSRILDKSINLIIKGPCTQDYKMVLEQKARKYGVLDKITFFGISPYSEVPRIAATCHIGIGIHAKSDTMNTTLGTASNKLYEYAALGLPILYFDSAHFNLHLADYEWAFPVKLDSNSIANAIEAIIKDYDSLSEKAHANFRKCLNYEFEFARVHNFLIDN
jgi:hypothetical protein